MREIGEVLLGQRRAAGWTAVVGAGGFAGGGLLTAHGTGLCPEHLHPGGVGIDYLLRAQRARLFDGAVVGGAVEHAALQRALVGQRAQEGADEVIGGVLVEVGVPDARAGVLSVVRVAHLDMPGRPLVELARRAPFDVAHCVR